MSAQFKIYLDVCCLNRPFDSWGQDRIRLEAEAVISILNRIDSNGWQLMSSTALVSEIAQTPDLDRRHKLVELLSLATININVTQDIMQRAVDIQTIGFQAFDALHLACAEIAKADIFLTTDDRLCRRAKTSSDQILVPVDNPLAWLISRNPSQE